MNKKVAKVIDLLYNKFIIFFYLKLNNKIKEEIILTNYFEIEALRKYLDLTHANLGFTAKLVGMDRATLWQALNGYEPSDKTRFKIKKFLNNQIDDIIRETNYDVDKRAIVRPESFKR